MPKTKKIKSVNFEKIVMGKVTTNKIVMKPKWYFILGSAFMGMSFVGISISVIFLINLVMFAIRRHGPMGEWRLQLMLESFPWWVAIFAVVGMILGIWIIKKYDFSYKKNFIFIVLGFVISIFIAAFILDYSGMNNIWICRGPMKNFYQQIENPNTTPSRRQGCGNRRE